MGALSGTAEDYASLFRLWIGLLIAYIPVCLFITLFFFYAFHTVVPGVVFAACWMGAYAVISYRLIYWKCNQCGFRYGLVYPLPTRCLNCKDRERVVPEDLAA